MTEEDRIRAMIRELDTDEIRLILKGHANCVTCPRLAVCIALEEDEYLFGCEECCGHDDPSGQHWLLEDVKPVLEKMYKITHN